jgi:hypothetical protein
MLLTWRFQHGPAYRPAQSGTRPRGEDRPGGTSPGATRSEGFSPTRPSGGPTRHTPMARLTQTSPTTIPTF